MVGSRHHSDAVLASTLSLVTCHFVLPASVYHLRAEVGSTVLQK